MAFPEQLTLKQRIMNAGVWSLAGYAINFVFRFGSNLFMTRQLVPEMFGVMAIATMVLVGLAMFSDVGLKPSIIQSKRGNEALFLNTAWLTQILRGVVLWCFAVIISLLIPLAGRFDLVPNGSVYENPSLPYVLVALSLTTIISGFESTKTIEAGRNLLVSRVTQMEIASQIFGLLVMVAWVLIDRSIWALVAGAISSSAMRTFLSHIWLPGISNRWQWDLAAFDEIIKFGKWIFLSSILYFLVSNGDRILLGLYIDAGSLGTYAIAYLIFSSIDQILTKVIVDVSFPALSEIARQRPATLPQAYYRFHTIIAAGAYWCCGFLFVSGQTIIDLLYDHRYEQAGWMLQVIAVALATIPIRLATQCFLVLGLSKVYFHLHTIRVIALFVLLPLGYQMWGLNGALWGVVLSYFASLPLTAHYARLHGMFDLKRELLSLLVLLVGAISGWALHAAVAFATHAMQRG